jgi:hypothetical protein
MNPTELPTARSLRDVDLKYLSGYLPSLKVLEDDEALDRPEGHSTDEGGRSRVEGGGTIGWTPTEEEGHARRVGFRSSGVSWLETIKETTSYELEDLGC